MVRGGGVVGVDSATVVVVVLSDDEGGGEGSRMICFESLCHGGGA